MLGVPGSASANKLSFQLDDDSALCEVLGDFTDFGGGWHYFVGIKNGTNRKALGDISTAIPSGKAASNDLFCSQRMNVRSKKQVWGI